MDQAAVDLFPQFSRSRLQAWIKSGELRVNGKICKQTARLQGDEELAIKAEMQSQEAFEPESMDMNVVFEDEAILVLSKPAGLVVHPAAGNWSGTLLNGLLAFRPCFGTLPRAGIVHRLDKDTSGLMVVAKSLDAQNSLVQQLQNRTVKRFYRAFSCGGPDCGGSIDAPIGRHPSVRTKMAVVKSGGKQAITHYSLLQYLDYFRDLSVSLETGRTHQIRVHLAYLGFPLIGDETYGKPLPTKLDIANDKRSAVESFPRQALHAERLSLIHPLSNEEMTWQLELPQDMLALLSHLEN